MPEMQVQVKKSAPAPVATPDLWRSFRSEVDRLFDRFTGEFGWPSFGRFFDLDAGWHRPNGFGFAAPPIDISEDEKAYKIAAELPGLEPKDIEVMVSGDMLILKGEKRQEKEETKKNTYVSERSYGAFSRSFQLPDSVDREKLAADFSKGVLTITLPKTATAAKSQKKIEVKAA